MNISDRAAIKALVVTTLEAAFAAQTSNPDLTGVSVHYGDPGDAITDEMVVLGPIEGQVDPGVFGPAGSHDEFTIACGVSIVGYTDAAEADERMQLVLNEINAALFQTSFAQATYNARVFPAKQDGPNGFNPYDGNTAGSDVELTIGVSVPVRGA